MQIHPGCVWASRLRCRRLRHLPSIVIVFLPAINRIVPAVSVTAIRRSLKVRRTWPADVYVRRIVPKILSLIFTGSEIGHLGHIDLIHPEERQTRSSLTTLVAKIATARLRLLGRLLLQTVKQKFCLASVHHTKTHRHKFRMCILIQAVPENVSSHAQVRHCCLWLSL